MEQKAEKVVWIGLVQVRSLPQSQVLTGVSGAFVNVLTWASNASEFQEKAEELMVHLGVKLIGVENPEPLIERQRQGELGTEIDQIALEMKENPNAIRYATFHTWTEVTA
jgi:hypothetical protein